jgi:hypothetical protein
VAFQQRAGRDQQEVGGGEVKHIPRSEILDAISAVVALRAKYSMEDTVGRWVVEENAPKHLHGYLDHASKSDFLDMWTTSPKERAALRKRIDRAQKGQHRKSPVKAKVLDDIYFFIRRNGAWPDTRDLEYEQGSSHYVVASDMISKAKEVGGRSVK